MKRATFDFQRLIKELKDYDEYCRDDRITSLLYHLGCCIEKSFSVIEVKPKQKTKIEKRKK